MRNFKVGDRIVLTKDRDNAKKGAKGTIIANMECGDWGVRFDEKFDGGHSLDGKCATGYGHWIAPYEMELLENKSQFKVGQIYRVGADPNKGTIARVKRVHDDAVDIKVIRGNADLCGFNRDSEAAHSLTLLTGPQIGEAIRKWDEEHSAKKTGVREVRRHAKAGEYIKIVTSFLPIGYKGGDILLVTKGFNDTSVICQGAKICVCDSEYVVLEGYKPTEDKAKEVKRQAQAGEYIKTTNTHCESGCYKSGDILLVFKRQLNGVYAFTSKRHPDHSSDTDRPTSWISDDEYVVLEGYKPEQKEEHRKAKVGDTIKVLRNNGGPVKAGTVWTVDKIDNMGLTVHNSDYPTAIWSINLDNYTVISSDKHAYAAEQIEQAKRIVLDTIREQAEQGKYVLFSHIVNGPQDNAGYYAYVTGGEGCHFGIIEDKDSRYYGAFISDSTERAGAKCSPNDEPNEWIGKCVALCKVLHKPVPDFITEG